MEGVKEKIDSLFKSGSNISRGQWIFAGILVLIAATTWFLVFAGFHQLYTDFQIWIAAFILIFTLSISVGLSYFLLHPVGLAAFAYLAISLVSFLFFQEILASAIFFLTTLFGYIWVRREQKLIISFLYSRLLRKGLPIFFTGLAFTLAVFYNTSPIGQISKVPQFSENLIGAALIPVEYAIRPSVPEFSRDMKISDVGKVSARELPKFIDLPPSIIASTVTEFFAKFPAEVSDKTITQFLHGMVNSQIRAILLPYRELLPFIYLFGLFLVFKAIGMPLMWLSIGTGWIITRILLKFKILKLKKIDVKKEELAL